MPPVKIMLVDDEERFLLTTAKWLNRKGYETLTAASGETALEELDRREVHVVILDVKMPGLGGQETLKAIRNRHPLVEVIMLTGHGTIESAVEGLKAGAFDYLTKPCDMDELLAKVHEAHDRRQKRDEKIRLAQARAIQRSPREILKGMNEDEE